jgi:hypothetical protein
MKKKIQGTMMAAVKKTMRCSGKRKNAGSAVHTRPHISVLGFPQK